MFGGDAHVGHHGEVEAARDRGTVHRGDERQREAEHGGVEPVARRPQLIGKLGLLELAQIEPGAEDVAGARDDDGLHRLVAAEVVERVRQLVTKRDSTARSSSLPG